MLGGDLVLPGSLVRDPRLNYVALGHIHKPQNLDEGGHHPVNYPGSIERVDFGEAADESFTSWRTCARMAKPRWNGASSQGALHRPLCARWKSQRTSRLRSKAAMPLEEQLTDAVVRLVVEYPFEYESLLDEAGLRKQGEACLEFHLVGRPQRETRIRLPQDQTISSLLLWTCWM